MNQSAMADLVLSNGAEVNFKVGNDVNGNSVVSYLQISFDLNRKIPQGGISATLLRELAFGELLTLWFAESSRSFLSKKNEDLLWNLMHNLGSPTGRRGLAPSYYASLAYLYLKQCELTPINPTSVIANRLQVSPKTVSTRLAKARAIGVLSSQKRGVSNTRAGGMLTAEGKKIITTFIKENN